MKFLKTRSSRVKSFHTQSSLTASHNVCLHGFRHSSFGAPSLLNFFIFILRFWNQILTCLSVRFSCLATSYLRSLVR